MAASNNVKFDDDKSELIHFEKTRNVSKDTLEFPNGTILEPKNVVKLLGVWLDRKLNFKKHVETRISSANRSFFAIQNLMKSEWGLNPTACRQLYLSCIVPISDYSSEIWYKGQKKYEILFQILQNRMIRKILGTFKTTPVQSMEIESHVLPVKLRLLMKNQKYAIRLLKIAENNPYLSKNSKHIFDKISKTSVLTLAYGITNMPNGKKMKNRQINDTLVSLFAVFIPFLT